MRVGLTGNIGSGKSTVAALLAELGAAVIDADALAREATRDPGVLVRIADEIGSEYVRAGELDRAALAALVFDDAVARTRLEAIVHPWVREAAAAREADAIARDHPALVVHDVPLLFETGLDATMDATVVVRAPLAARVARVVARGGVDADTVHARDAAQLPLDEKAERATFVVDNSGHHEHLRTRVAALQHDLMVLRSSRNQH
ncbi:MAG: dephospho-CoA kinase [Trueperaceae bacterium]|nr:dephospho-CoA kinase [Trueperaceae bacterium]